MKISISLVVSLLYILLFIDPAFAQTKETAWDNTVKQFWSKEFKLVDITSTIDKVKQKAWFYPSTKTEPQPLIISLHTWSGDYNQEDPLAKEILLRDWNYLHPDFRGANNNPNACGSELVIADIEDAIRFAITNGNVDTNNVHIIGVSGGAYAAMLAYMKLNFPVKSFNAWVGISDLRSWYWESKGRQSKYATDIEQVAMSNGQMNWNELDNRSPLHLPFPANKRINATLNLYTGIHDGYTGSVPISQTILFYNKIAVALYPELKEQVIPDSIVVSLVTKRMNPAADTTIKLSGRGIQLFKQLPNLSLTIFEGGHEMLIAPALVLPPIDENKNFRPFHILTIGDSNGAFEFGWPQQMNKLLPYSMIVNQSIAGNTIGFDNLGYSSLNTKKNITQYLDDAYNTIGNNKELDYIFLNIGTNDTKVVFKEKQKEVLKNLDTLLQSINLYIKEHHKKRPNICLISPSPVDESKIDVVKYGGSDLRIQDNNKKFKKIAFSNQVDFLDTYSIMYGAKGTMTTDGIHLNENAQFQLASIIITYINSKK